MNFNEQITANLQLYFQTYQKTIQKNLSMSLK